MLRYVAKRLLLIIPLVFCVSILIFTAMCFVPGDPMTILMADSTATKEQIEQAREEAGYNDPYVVRLGRYLNDLFHGEMGTSYKTGKPVVSEIIERFPNTLKIAIGSILVTILLGIPLGVISAVNAEKPADRISMVATLIFNSMPTFWLDLMLVLLFSVALHWLPTSGDKSFKYFILPVLGNSLGGVAGLARQTRSSMLEVIRSDYVTTARSKGLSERVVIFKHAFPNALIPVVTNIGTRFGLLLGGTTVTETIFAIPGLGMYMINGINNRDYSVVQGAMLYLAVTFMLMMLVTDLAYAFIDPRIKAQYVSKKGGK